MILDLISLATAFGLGAFVCFAALRVKLENLQAAHRKEMDDLRKSLQATPHHPV